MCVCEREREKKRVCCVCVCVCVCVFTCEYVFECMFVEIWCNNTGNKVMLLCKIPYTSGSVSACYLVLCCF